MNDQKEKSEYSNRDLAADVQELRKSIDRLTKSLADSILELESCGVCLLAAELKDRRNIMAEVSNLENIIAQDRLRNSCLAQDKIRKTHRSWIDTSLNAEGQERQMVMEGIFVKENEIDSHGDQFSPEAVKDLNRKLKCGKVVFKVDEKTYQGAKRLMFTSAMRRAGFTMEQIDRVEEILSSYSYPSRDLSKLKYCDPEACERPIFTGVDPGAPGGDRGVRMEFARDGEGGGLIPVAVDETEAGPGRENSAYEDQDLDAELIKATEELEQAQDSLRDRYSKEEQPTAEEHEKLAVAEDDYIRTQEEVKKEEALKHAEASAAMGATNYWNEQGSNGGESVG